MRYLVKIHFGDDKELRSYAVHAPSIGEAAAIAHTHVLGLVEAEPVGQIADDVPDDFYDDVLAAPARRWGAA